MRKYLLLFLVLCISPFFSCSDPGSNDDTTSGKEYTDQEIINILTGDWVESNPSYQGTYVIQYLSDMTRDDYYDYALTDQADSDRSWDVQNGDLLFDGLVYGVEIISNDSFKMTYGSYEFIYFRKGTETSIFNTPSSTLNIGSSLVRSISENQLHYYQSSVTIGTNYVLSWDEEYGSGTYDGDIDVSIFDSNHSIAEAYVYKKDLGYSVSDRVTITPDENTLYIVVDAGFNSGSYQIYLTTE